jgi:NADH-quinone oxidoreductase subunit C
LTQADYADKGYHLDFAATPEKLMDAVRALDREAFFLEAVTGVDWPVPKTPPKAPPKAADAEGETGESQPAAVVAPVVDEMEVVYDFNHYSELCRVTLRVRIPRDEPRVPSISALYPGANWHERETHEFFGIVFEGHPNLEPLLLPEDADFHPLRKDFVS